MRTTRLRLAATILLASLSGSAGAQAFTENFNDITTLAGSGWFMQNSSAPVGITNWFQGTSVAGGGPFDAYNGAANAYIGANYNNTAGGSGIISNWLMTPNRTFRNGDVLTFFTRKPATPAGGTDYPDRMELRLSTNGSSTNTGAGGNTVGDFTTLLLSVNPTLVAGGYPYAWTQYTVTVSGLSAPTSGRIAFRYFVTSAGPSGTNSDYIGIDNAVYTPYVCPTLQVTGTPPGGVWGQAYSASMEQTGALGAPQYAIVSGALPPGLTLSPAGVISGTPSATGSFDFTLMVSDASGCSGAANHSITIVPDLPGAPGDVDAVAGDAQIAVSWMPPAVDGGAVIETFTATCSDGGNAHSETVTASPAIVTGLTNGVSYGCAVAATNAAGSGAATAAAGSVTPMGEQSITFGAQADQTYSPGGTFPIDPLAVASSGLPVSYGTSTPQVCSVSGTTVSIVSAGTCTLTADQSGDTAWNPAAQATQSLLIAQASQTLTFPAQTVTTRWFKAGNTFAIDPLASSAEPHSGAPIVYSSLSAGVCSVSGTTVTMLAEGTCSIAADQAGDGNYAAAAQVSVQVVLVAPTEADLWIGKSAWKATAIIGDTVGYTIDVGNLGQAHATDVRVFDPVPARLDPATVVWQCMAAVGTTCPPPGSGTGALDVVIASLPRDASVQFELYGVVIPAADPANDFMPFDNVATITLPAGSPLSDPVPGNNTGTATISVLSQPDALFTDGFDMPQR